MAVLHVNAQTTTRYPTWRRHSGVGCRVGWRGHSRRRIVPLVFGTPLPQVHIRWREISVDQRIALERRFALTEATRLDDDAWSYVPTDTSRERLVAIVTDPAVADTDGINRRTFSISDTPPLTPRRGGLLDAPPWMARVTILLGYLLALLSALFFVRATVASPALRAGSPIRRAIDPSVRGQRSHRAWSARLLSTARKREVPGRLSRRPSRLLGATLAWRFVTFTGFTNDHYVHLALAQQMLMGDRPIRDFADSGWPLMYLLSAAPGVSRATRWSSNGRSLPQGLRSVPPARLSRLPALRISGDRCPGRDSRDPDLPAHVFISQGADLRGRRRRAWLRWRAAIAPSHRADGGSRGCGVSVPSRPRTVRRRRRGRLSCDAEWREGLVDFRQANGRSDGSTGALLLPWIAFIAMNGGLIAYFEGGLEYSRAEADATALAALPTLNLTSPLSTVANAEAWLFWLFWGITALCGVVLFVRVASRRERWPGESAAVAGLVTMAVLVNASFLRQALQVRLPDAIVPAAVLGAWALGLCWTADGPRRSIQLVFQLATIIVLSVSMAAISRIVDLPGLYDNTDIGRGMARAREHAGEVSGQLRTRHRDNVSPPSRVSTRSMPFIDYLDRCTSATDRLIITGEFPEILVIAGRKFAGDGVVFGSWYASAANQERTVRRLEASPPLFVIHAGDYEGFRGRFGLVDAFVNEAYERIRGPGRRNQQRPHPGGPEPHRIRTDPETDLGCYR